MQEGPGVTTRLCSKPGGWVSLGHRMAWRHHQSVAVMPFGVAKANLVLNSVYQVAHESGNMPCMSAAPGGQQAKAHRNSRQGGQAPMGELHECGGSAPSYVSVLWGSANQRLGGVTTPADRQNPIFSLPPTRYTTILP